MSQRYNDVKLLRQDLMYYLVLDHEECGIVMTVMTTIIVIVLSLNQA